MTVKSAPPTAPPGGLREWALDQIPGRHDLATAVKRSIAGLAAPAPVDRFPTLQKIYGDAADALVAGDGLPPDFESRIAELDAAVAAAVVRGKHAFEVRTVLADRLAAVERDGLDTALAALHDRLIQLVTEVKEVAPAVAGITGTDAAMRAGGRAAEAWGRLLDLVDQHQVLRRVQLGFHAEALGGTSHTQRAGQLLDEVGRLANAAEMDPIAARRESNEVRSPAWPEPIDGEAYVLWLATGEGEPWVPTPRQLLDAHADVRARQLAADHERDRAQGLVPSLAQQRAVDKRVTGELAYHASRAEAEAAASSSASGWHDLPY